LRWAYLFYPSWGISLDVRAVLPVVKNDYRANLALAVYCVISYDTTHRVVLHKLDNINPSEESFARDLAVVWAGLVKSLRVIDREHPEEQLRMIFIKALAAHLKIGVTPLDGLKVKSCEIGSEATSIAESKCPFASGIRDSH
jgi:hypothetical protein